MSTLVSGSPVTPMGVMDPTAPWSVPAPTRSIANGRRGWMTMLLAAVVATLVVLADQLNGTWADRHLFMAWVALWVVVFASLALSANQVRTLSRRMRRGLDGWSQSMAQRRAEARMWEMAKSDSRLMAELLQARARYTGTGSALTALANGANHASHAQAHTGLKFCVRSPALLGLISARRAWASLQAWSQARAKARDLQRLWHAAHGDPRLLADMMPISAYELEEARRDRQPWGRFPESLRASRDYLVHESHR